VEQRRDATDALAIPEIQRQQYHQLVASCSRNLRRCKVANWHGINSGTAKEAS
jgi:hypothetical protein